MVAITQCLLTALVAAPLAAASVETLTAGFGPENATQHAGYIGVNKEKGNDGHLFFWMFEARNNPQTAPLVLWLTGGPGCSSELAVFYEQGPYRLGKDGSVTTNPHSWTEIANVLFVDQPVGTGFSYADDSAAYVKSEEGVATDMWEFLQTFMKQFPQYSKLDFFVTGESYAGHYVPAISSKIVHNNAKLGAGEVEIRLQGLAIGNGLVDPATQYGEYVPYAQSKGLVTHKQAVSLNRTAHACQKSIRAGHKGTATLMECNSMMERIMMDGGGFNTYDVRIKCAKPPLCYDFSPLDTLLAREDVRKALGVSPKSKWQSCNMKVHEELMSDWFTDMETVIPPMLEAGVRVLVYSGQEDFICNWFGGRAWVDNMEWSGSAAYKSQSWSDWSVSTEVAGTFKEQGPLQFLGVSGAGHMVPMDQPENALVMLHTFVEGRSLNCDAGARRDMVGCDKPPVNSSAVAATHGDYCFVCSEVVKFALDKGCDAVLCDVIAGELGPEASATCKKLESVASMFGDSLCGYIEKKAKFSEHAEAICNDLKCEGDGPAAVHTKLVDLSDGSSGEFTVCVRSDGDLPSVCCNTYGGKCNSNGVDLWVENLNSERGLAGYNHNYDHAEFTVVNNYASSDNGWDGQMYWRNDGSFCSAGGYTATIKVALLSEAEELKMGWSPADEPQSCIDKAKELCGDCGLKKNLCWVRCAKKHEAELQAAGCTAPSASKENTKLSLTGADKEEATMRNAAEVLRGAFGNGEPLASNEPMPAVLQDKARLETLFKAMEAAGFPDISNLPSNVQADALALKRFVTAHRDENGLTCAACRAVVGTACGSGCHAAICYSVILCPWARVICTLITSWGCDTHRICAHVGFCNGDEVGLLAIGDRDPGVVLETQFAKSEHPIMLQDAFQHALEDNMCSWGRSQESISSYSYMSWRCSSWGDVSSANFKIRWNSVNNDAVKISYGWCASSCTSSYRDSGCSWGPERTEKGNNFEHTIDRSVSNTYFKNPASCVQMKCDNWVSKCQMVVSEIVVQ